MEEHVTEGLTAPMKSLPEPEPMKQKPIPFDINLHGHRYRRQENCEHQYVLFLIDTSGSIGETNFCAFNCELANLVQWFCKPISLAVMTFSHTFHKEFCFDAYSNDCFGRESAKFAIKNIGYRGGGTHTGTAFECASREMLNGDCGFPGSYDCLSIVTITDGMSNGPRRVCDVVENYRRENNVKTYSIGIGDNVNEQELQCLASSQQSHHFQHQDFQSFVNELTDLYGILESNLLPFTCANAAYASTPLGTERSCSDIENDDC